MKILIFITVLLLTACHQVPASETLKDPSPVQQIPPSTGGLILELMEHSYTGSPDEIKTNLKNENRQAYEYGDYYYIEVKKNGKWFILVHSDAVFLQNPQFTDFGRTLAAKSQVQQTFSVDLLGVTLVPGEYRLVKTFLSQQQPFHEISLAFPFTVE